MNKIRIVNFSLTRSVPLPHDNPDLTALKVAIKSHLPTYSYETFRVSAKRADKRFSKTSMEVEKEIGAAVAEHTGKRVNLSHPDLTILVELVPPEAYYSCHRESGPGALKLGTWRCRAFSTGSQGLRHDPAKFPWRLPGL